jgi:hypothetical protein
MLPVVNVYTLSDALSPAQTFNTFWLASALVLVGIVLIEKQLVLFLAGAPGRLLRRVRAVSRRAVH